MATFLRNVLKQNVARALSDDVLDDLPVNPLKAIYYTLRLSQNAASTTADTITSLTNILAAVTKIEVLIRGTAVLSGSLTDIAIMNAILHGRYPFIINTGDGSANPIAVTIPILLGRWHMADKECFPATRKGELQLHRVIAASTTNITSGSITEQIETLELLDAQPTSFLKYVTLSKTWAATGDNDFDLPMGNPMLGALLWGTTGFANLTSAASWNKVKLLVDNVEYLYALANWETLLGNLNRHLPLADDLQNHTHTENLAAAYAADAASAKPKVTAPLLQNYAYLDFDPFGDGNYALQTAGRGRVHIRANAGTADAVRALPLEVISLGAPPQ